VKKGPRDNPDAIFPNPYSGADCGKMTGFLLRVFHASCISNMVVMINIFPYGRWRSTVIFILTPIKTFGQSRFLRGPSQAVLS
jgi:hypothetical protein